MNFSNKKIGVISLGYVGLPLAVEFGKKYPTLGFDINQGRVEQLLAGHDSTLEVSDEELKDSPYMDYSFDPSELSSCNVYIITVPTPIDEHNQPDLTPLIKASQMLGAVVKKGDILVYESTVYPGATEEVCIPEVEKVSGLKFNVDFYAGYSPERINPGDKNNKLSNIVKITSGSTPEIADIVDELYRSIITAGTHKAESIRVAEAAKVLENTQRDVNIALINEHAIIFNKLGIDTEAVLLAAGTKWNFLNFRPGLVGGHCIGVDPYYFTHKAQSIGYHPAIILSSRRINDGMGSYVSQQLITKMVRNKITIPNSKVLILGFTFKEDCPDIRNTRVMDIVEELGEFDVNVDIYDPWCNKEDIGEYNINLIDELIYETYDSVIIAVAHKYFKDLGPKNIRNLCKDKNSIVYDLKYLLKQSESDLRL